MIHKIRSLQSLNPQTLICIYVHICIYVAQMRVVGVLGTGKPFIQDETDPGGWGGGGGGGGDARALNSVEIKY
jgi:hypothetical protein